MEAGNTKKLGFYAVAGVLIAVVIIAGMYVSGVQFPNHGKVGPSEVKVGTLIVKVTDAPVDLETLNLTIDSLSIQGEGGWIQLKLLGEVDKIYFNLLALQNVSETLSVTEIPEGNYTMLKMHVAKANASYTNGDVVDLRVPSEDIKVLLKPHLEMKAEGAITVTIDLEPDLSKIVISKSLNLKPVVKAIIAGED